MASTYSSYILHANKMNQPPSTNSSDVQNTPMRARKKNVGTANGRIDLKVPTIQKRELRSYNRRQRRGRPFWSCSHCLGNRNKNACIIQNGNRNTAHEGKRAALPENLQAGAVLRRGQCLKQAVASSLLVVGVGFAVQPVVSLTPPSSPSATWRPPRGPRRPAPRSLPPQRCRSRFRC